jgi:hypothetical protein
LVVAVDDDFHVGGATVDVEEDMLAVIMALDPERSGMGVRRGRRREDAVPSGTGHQ